MVRKVLLLTITVVLYACGGYEPPTHVVSWVVDGDTLYVEGVENSIRIADIDAPELGSEEGEIVKWFVIDLIHAEYVQLDCDGVDKFDRHLCLVYIDGVSVSDILLDEFPSVRRWK